jgi:hypothetical protein
MHQGRLLLFAFLFFCFATLPLIAQQPASDPSPILSSLEQTSHTSVSDISRLRIDKWKADGGTKRNAQSDSESISRNMNAALPELIGKVRTAPQDLNANFKLYRNLNVLYEYFSRFTESVGAFGNRDDFEALARDLDGLDSARRAMADRMDSLTSSVDARLAQYQSQARAAQSAATAAPAKKIVIDDTEPEKKPAKKKKSAPKPANPSAAPATGTNSATPPKS